MLLSPSESRNCHLKCSSRIRHHFLLIKSPNHFFHFLLHLNKRKYDRKQVFAQTGTPSIWNFRITFSSDARYSRLQFALNCIAVKVNQRIRQQVKKRRHSQDASSFSLFFLVAAVHLFASSPQASQWYNYSVAHIHTRIYAGKRTENNSAQGVIIVYFTFLI